VLLAVSNRFSSLFHCWREYEICYRKHFQIFRHNLSVLLCGLGSAVMVCLVSEKVSSSCDLHRYRTKSIHPSVKFTCSCYCNSLRCNLTTTVYRQGLSSCGDVGFCVNYANLSKNSCPTFSQDVCCILNVVNIHSALAARRMGQADSYGRLC